MTQEQIMETLNAQFKNFFNACGFKVKKERKGMKATNSNVLLSFCIDYDRFADWYIKENQVDSEFYVKLPYSDYNVAIYTFKLDTALSNDVLGQIFTDGEFLALLDFELPNIRKKLV